MTTAISSLSSLTQTSSTNPYATARSNVMSAVAGELGISQSDLQSQVQSGRSLADIAKTAGISSDQLNATITGALQKAGLPAGADISTMASRMASHVGGHHHHKPEAAQDSTATDSTSTTATDLTALTSTASSVDTYA